MKTYKNLWSEFISDENIKLAIKNFSKGKKNRKKVRKILENEEKWVFKIREYAINFTHFYHKPKEIYDGISRKKREIVIPTVMESILHHMIVQVLMPMFTKGMYEHSYGSVPGRGGLYGKKHIAKWIRKGGRDIKYIYKLDIRHFYPNIPQSKLMDKLRSKVHDRKLILVIEEVIKSVPSGLPLGFYTSVWFANWYLQDIDHKIKECGIDMYYARYVDDMVIFCSNKKKLRKIRGTLLNELLKHGLSVKGNWQIFRFHYLPMYPRVSKSGKPATYGRPLDFMGYKFYRNRTTLRKSILRNIRRKALNIWHKEKATVYDARQSLSALGWIKSSNVYNYYEKHIKPFLDFGKMKRIVSNADKLRRYNNGVCFS